MNSSFPPSAPSVAVGVIPTLGFAPSVAVGVIPAAAVGIAVAGVEGASVVVSMDVEGASVVVSMDVEGAWVVVSMGAAAEDGVASCALW